MPFGPIANLLAGAIYFINVVLVPLLMAIAFVAFLWGVFQYFIAGGASDEKRAEGRKFVMWSVIGFVLIFSIWGIVALLMRSLGFGSQIRPPLPSFGSPTQSRTPSNMIGGGSAGPGNLGGTCDPTGAGTSCNSGNRCADDPYSSNPRSGICVQP